MQHKDNTPPRCTGAGKSQICEYRDQCNRYQRYKNERRIIALSIMSKPEGVCDVFQRKM